MMPSAPASPPPRSVLPAIPNIVALVIIPPALFHLTSTLGRLPLPMNPQGASPPDTLNLGSLGLGSFHLNLSIKSFILLRAFDTPVFKLSHITLGFGSFDLKP